MWLDSHCHITADAFDADRDAVMERARAARVERMIVIGSGYGVDGNQDALRFAADDTQLFATVGVHPHESETLDDAGRDRLRTWLREPGVVAVGECGLDYYYMNSPRETQRSVFAEQVCWAREFDLPVSIHVRDRESAAYDELLDIWLAEGRGEVQGVLHCYTGSLEFARRALEANFFVSFSGIVTFKKSSELRQVVRELPLERLMIETDAPFLAPEGHRGKRNEPAWVPVVGAHVAELQGAPLEDVARVTRQNAQQLFRLPE